MKKRGKTARKRKAESPRAVPSRALRRPTDLVVLGLFGGYLIVDLIILAL